MPRITDFAIGEMVRCIDGTGYGQIVGGSYYYRTPDSSNRPTVSSSCGLDTPPEERTVAHFYADFERLEFEDVSQKSIQGRMYFKDWYRETLCTSKTGTE